jgi:NAD(P)-dependent dehydrogenase (short-subunit alcohol dehydrogenase family)
MHPRIQSVRRTSASLDSMTDLKGKVALVTGGARGLGAEICRVLNEAGATVVIADVREDLANSLQGELNGNGCAASVMICDVSDPAAIDAAIGQVLEQHGHVDILVNNAAIDNTVSVEEMSTDEWDRILNVNLHAPFYLSKRLFTEMKNNGGGAIVNIASTASRRAWENASAYHASKWGLLGFSHALHTEGRKVGIKVTAVISGGMRTPFLLDRFPEIPLDVLQDPRNVAEAVKFALMQPAETVIPEIMVVPMKETSFP